MVVGHHATSTGYDLIFDSCRVLYLVRKWHAPLNLTFVLLAQLLVLHPITACTSSVSTLTTARSPTPP
eukprot:5216105-Amphidinium_carterae.1